MLGVSLAAWSRNFRGWVSRLDLDVDDGGRYFAAVSVRRLTLSLESLRYTDGLRLAPHKVSRLLPYKKPASLDGLVIPHMVHLISCLLTSRVVVA